MEESLIQEVKEILQLSPLLLLDKVKKDKKILDIANSFLPYSVGTEIEASYIVNETPLLVGKYLLDKRTISSFNEVSFRIPNGYKGLLALELFSIELKDYLTQSNSGNHYHIDLSDNYNDLSSALKLESEYILSELDSWNYKGSFNKRTVDDGKCKWVGLRNTFKTVEIRIGELAIDYPTLFKRINHCSNIVSNVREKYNLQKKLSFNNNFSKEDVLETLEQIDSNYEKYHSKYIENSPLFKKEVKKKDLFISQNSKSGIDFVKNKKIICY